MSDSTASFRETYDHSPGTSPGTGEENWLQSEQIRSELANYDFKGIFYVKLLSRGPGGHQNQMMIAMVSRVMFLKLQLESCFVLNCNEALREFYLSFSS